jgi:hypothetical protein
VVRRRRDLVEELSDPQKIVSIEAVHSPLPNRDTPYEESKSTTKIMSCQDIQLEYPDEFSDVFADTNAIRFAHAAAPRYGHTANISKLLDGTEDDKEDYLRGLLASSITIFSFFVVWMFVLLAFKWSGPHSVGVLSGRRLPLPPKPETENYEDDMEGYQEALDEWNRIYHKVNRSQNVMKGLVVFAGLSIIVSSILLSVKGYVNEYKSEP